MRIEEAKHVTVHFPEFKSRIESACHPEMTVTYSVGEEDDYDNGIFSKDTFIANCELWASRGYEMKIW